jgi:hypothetical protein
VLEQDQTLTIDASIIIALDVGDRSYSAVRTTFEIGMGTICKSKLATVCLPMGMRRR